MGTVPLLACLLSAGAMIAWALWWRDPASVPAILPAMLTAVAALVAWWVLTVSAVKRGILEARAETIAGRRGAGRRR